MTDVAASKEQYVSLDILGKISRQVDGGGVADGIKRRPHGEHRVGEHDYSQLGSPLDSGLPQAKGPGLLVVAALLLKRGPKQVGLVG